MVCGQHGICAPVWLSLDHSHVDRICVRVGRGVDLREVDLSHGRQSEGTFRHLRCQCNFSFGQPQPHTILTGERAVSFTRRLVVDPLQCNGRLKFLLVIRACMLSALHTVLVRIHVPKRPAFHRVSSRFLHIQPLFGLETPLSFALGTSPIKRPSLSWSTASGIEVVLPPPDQCGCWYSPA